MSISKYLKTEIGKTLFQVRIEFTQNNNGMEFKKFEVIHQGQKFLIEEDLPEVGAYLYMYEGKISKRDWLQNNIEMCKQFAFEEYGVPLNGWLEVQN